MVKTWGSLTALELLCALIVENWPTTRPTLRFTFPAYSLTILPHCPPSLASPVPKSSYCLERRAHTLFAVRFSGAYSLQYPDRKSAWGGSAFGRYDVGQ